jgi:hypothetical protein
MKWGNEYTITNPPPSVFQILTALTKAFQLSAAFLTSTRREEGLLLI